MGINFLGVLFYSLIPFGQLITRIVDYNGSIDRWWFLLIPFFLFPPLQFIPILMLYLGWIKPGKIKKIYDIYVFIPIILKVILTFIDQYLLYPFIYHYHPTYITYFYFFIEFILLISIIITKYLNTTNICKSSNYTDKLTQTHYINILINSIFELGIAGLTFSIMTYIPYLGDLITLLSKSVIIRNILKCIL